MSPTRTPPSVDREHSVEPQRATKHRRYVLIILGIAVIGAVLVALGIVGFSRPGEILPPDSTFTENMVTTPNQAPVEQRARGVVPLAEMELSELQQLATSLGIAGANSMTRAQIIEAFADREPLMARCLNGNCVI
jgi:Rho termination factor, N-terminal domain